MEGKCIARKKDYGIDFGMSLNPEVKREVMRSMYLLRPDVVPNQLFGLTAEKKVAKHKMSWNQLLRHPCGGIARLEGCDHPFGNDCT